MFVFHLRPMYQIEPPSYFIQPILPIIEVKKINTINGTVHSNNHSQSYLKNQKRNPQINTKKRYN